jgi:rfaE bifunctional protein kinase chain/domain
MNIASLGATPVLVSVTGKDNAGNALQKILADKGMETGGLLRSGNRHTSVKERIISGSQHLLRIDEESIQNLVDKENKSLLERIERFLPSCHLVICEDYDKGLFGRENISAIIRMAHKHGIPVAVDPKRKNFMEYRNADLFKPNFSEIRDGMKAELDKGDIRKLKQEVKNLVKSLSLGAVLVTLSEYGMYYGSPKHSIYIKAHKREVADVSGAGDTVISIAGLCLAMGLPPRFTAALSNLGGGLVCEQQGVVPVDREHLASEAKREKLDTLLK